MPGGNPPGAADGAGADDDEDDDDGAGAGADDEDALIGSFIISKNAA